MSRRFDHIAQWMATWALVSSLTALMYSLAVLVLRATVDLLVGDWWQDLRRLLAALLIFFLLVDLAAVILGMSMAIRAGPGVIRRRGWLAVVGGLTALGSIWIGGAVL